MAALAEAIGRKHGRTAVLPLSVAPVAQVQRLPFGVLMLDWMTGGGLVVGRVNRLWGPKSTLKSTLCLLAVRSAQNHCRHCKEPLVAVPGEFSGAAPRRNCACPDPRWWLENEDDYAWLPNQDAIKICYGALPDNAKVLDKTGSDGGLRAVVVYDPPPHVAQKKRKEVVFAQMVRCEPWRCLYLDAESTISREWAISNGVDVSLVDLVGSSWAERCYMTLEEASLSREADLLVIDSTSVLESKSELEKSMADKPKVADRARTAARFVRRHIVAASQDGLTARYAPTLLAVSQVTTQGLGSSYTYLSATDGNMFNHAVSLDVMLRAEGYQFDVTKSFAISGKFGFTIKYNKAGGGVGTQGVIRYWLKETADHPVGDTDDLDTVLEYARKPGIELLCGDTGRYVLTTRYAKDGSIQFKTLRDCMQYLRDNPTMYMDIRRTVLTTLLRQGTVPCVEGSEQGESEASQA